MALGETLAAMAKKRKMKSKEDATLPIEVRKNIRKLCRFSRSMHRGQAIAETNSHAWHDLVGAAKTIHRIALMKSQDTLHAVKALERHARQGTIQDEISKEAINDNIRLANTLIAQGMHWDKVEGALVRLQSLCANEDETLRGKWEFSSPELASPKVQKSEPDN